MTRRIAVAIAKGGQGKTTTAVNLAAALAAAGQRVLLIETDSQYQCAPALGAKPPAGLYEFIHGEVKPSEALFEARPNLRLLSGGERLAELRDQFALANVRREWQLADALEGLDPFFDFILVDTGPGWDVMAYNVLFYVAELLCPVTLEGLAVSGLLEFWRRVEELPAKGRAKIAHILPTMLDQRVAQSGEFLTQLQARYGDLMCEPIRYSVRLSEAPVHGETIFDYDPRGRGAADYERLAQRILNYEPEKHA